MKWIYSLPSIFWIGAVIVAYRSGLTPWGDAVIFFIVGSIPLLFLTATALLRVSRKGSIEFSPEGVKIISKGVVLFESSMSDLRKLQVRARRRNILGSQKMLVFVTQYSREIPLTEWVSAWDMTGEEVIRQALVRGLRVEMIGDPVVTQALEGPPD